MKLLINIKDRLSIIKHDINTLLKRENEETRNLKTKVKDELISIIDALLSEETEKQREAVAGLKKIISDVNHPYSGDAHAILGSLYEFGVDIKDYTDQLSPNRLKANEEYKLAFDKNSASGATYHADTFFYGKGIAENKAEGLKLYNDILLKHDFSGAYLRKGRDFMSRYLAEKVVARRDDDLLKQALHNLELALDRGSVIAALELGEYHIDLAREKTLRSYTLPTASDASFASTNPKTMGSGHDNTEELKRVQKGLALMIQAAEHLIYARYQITQKCLELFLWGSTHFGSEVISNFNSIYEKYLPMAAAAGYRTAIIDLALSDKEKDSKIRMDRFSQLEILAKEENDKFPITNPSAPEFTRSARDALRKFLPIIIRGLQEKQQPNPASISNNTAAATTSQATAASTSVILNPSEDTKNSAEKRVVSYEVSVSKESFNLLIRAYNVGVPTMALARCYRYGIGSNVNDFRANTVYRESTPLVYSLSCWYERLQYEKQSVIKQLSCVEEARIRERILALGYSKRKETFSVIANNLTRIIKEVEFEDGSLFALAHLGTDVLIHEPESIPSPITWYSKKAFDHGFNILLYIHGWHFFKKEVNLNSTAAKKVEEATGVISYLDESEKIFRFFQEKFAVATIDLTTLGMKSNFCFPFSSAFVLIIAHIRGIGVAADSAVQMADIQKFPSIAQKKGISYETEKEDLLDSVDVDTLSEQANIPKASLYFKFMVFALKLARLTGDDNGDGAYYIGQCYEKGMVVERDLRKALTLYENSIRIKTKLIQDPYSNVAEVDLEQVKKRKDEVENCIKSIDALSILDPISRCFSDTSECNSDSTVGSAIKLPDLCRIVAAYAIEPPIDSEHPYTYTDRPDLGWGAPILFSPAADTLLPTAIREKCRKIKEERGPGRARAAVPNG